MKRIRVPLSYPALDGFDGVSQATCRGGSFAVESVATLVWNTHTLLNLGVINIFLATVAQSLGLAPTTLFGLTVAGWAMVATSVAVVGLGYFISRKKLSEINDERVKGGLANVTWGQIILDRLSESVVIKGKTYSVTDLKYVIAKNGGEYIGKRSSIPCRMVVLFVVTKKTNSNATSKRHRRSQSEHSD